MKNKRFLSLILAIVLTVSLFAGISTTAYADNNVVTYTVKQNDYLWKICKGLGLDYYTCKEAILLLNGFTSETQLNRLYVGQQIKLPASNAVAQTVTKTTTTTVNVGNTVVNTNTNTTTASNDSVVYYLVNYSVKSGDTLYKICNSLGTSYAQYADQILIINGITSVTHIWAGKTIFIPVNNKPTSGTYYSVVKHKVTSGETLTSICNNYGINYSANTKLVQGLNDGYNLNAIKVGQQIYVPTTKSFTPVTPTATATATSTASPTASPSVGDYDINFNTGAHGNVYTTINNKRVTAANEGDTVTVKVAPDSGYILESLSVTKKSGAKISVTSNTFKMPAGDVTVTAKFTTGEFTITQNTPSNGSVIVLVNGYEGTTANNGDKITVKTSPKSGYKVSSVTYANSGSSVTVEPDDNGNYIFYMPKHNIKVNVTFAVASYIVPTFTKISGSEGTAKLTVERDGTAVNKNRMYEGNTYIVKIAPDSKCAVDTEVATSLNGKTSSIVELFDSIGNLALKATKIDSVTYQVYLAKIVSGTTDAITVSAKIDKTNAFSLNYSSNISSCSAIFKVCKDGETLYDNAVSSTTAVKDRRVYILPNAVGDCVFSSASATIAGGASPITVSLDSSVGKYYFTMPAADVTVNLIFTQTYVTKYSFITVIEDSSKHVSFVSYDESGNIRTKYAAGEWARIDPSDYIPSGYTVDHIEVGSLSFKNYTLGQSTRADKTGYWIQFPADAIYCKVVITQSTAPKAYKTILVKSLSGNGTAEIRANGVNVTQTVSSDYPEYYEGKINVGTVIQIVGIPIDETYKVKSVSYDKGKLLNPDGNGNYYYTVKEDDKLDRLTFEVDFESAPKEDTYYVIKNSNPKRGTCEIGIFNGTSYDYENDGVSTYATEGSMVDVRSYFGSEYSIHVKIDNEVVKPKISDDGSGGFVSNYEFKMPDHDVNVVVTFSEN